MKIFFYTFQLTLQNSPEWNTMQNFIIIIDLLAVPNDYHIQIYEQVWIIL